MKDRLLDVLKWRLAIVIAGIVFYLVYPKYYFINTITRGNKITGKVEVLKKGDWVRSPFGYKNLYVTPEDVERWLK